MSLSQSLFKSKFPFVQSHITNPFCTSESRLFSSSLSRLNPQIHTLYPFLRSAKPRRDDLVRHFELKTRGKGKFLTEEDIFFPEKAEIERESELDKVYKPGEIIPDDRYRRFVLRSGEYRSVVIDLRKKSKQLLEREEEKKVKRYRDMIWRRDRRPIVNLPVGHITPKSLSDILRVRTIDLLKVLISFGERPQTAYEILTKDHVEILCQSFCYEPQWTESVIAAKLRSKPNEGEKIGKIRRAIVTVLGHVDHGKTSLLDYLRQSNRAANEAGGITQEVAAFQVPLIPNATSEIEKSAIFIDTPGHEAFSAMRKRGASITDIAILVVAVDAGVQQQTIEAIQYLHEFKSKFIVVLNKIDKISGGKHSLQTCIQKITSQLAQQNVFIEQMGGDVPMVPISATTGEGIDQLKESLALMASEMDLHAPSTGSGEGVILETRIDKHLGIVCVVITTWGTFKGGDFVFAGTVNAKIKFINDCTSKKRVSSTSPSQIIEIYGFKEVPSAGDDIFVVKSETEARRLASTNKEIIGSKQLPDMQLKDITMMAERARYRLTTDEIIARQNVSDNRVQLNLVVKADVFGSLEVLSEIVKTLPGQDLVKVGIINSGLGVISEKDIDLVKDTESMIIAFNIRVQPSIKALADKSRVTIVNEDVVFTIRDKIIDRIEYLHPSVEVKTNVATAEVLQMFTVDHKIHGDLLVAGSKLVSGVLETGLFVRLVREDDDGDDENEDPQRTSGESTKENISYGEENNNNNNNDDSQKIGEVVSLRRFKDELSKIDKPVECGIGIKGIKEVKKGDKLIFFKKEMQKPNLPRTPQFSSFI